MSDVDAHAKTLEKLKDLLKNKYFQHSVSFEDIQKFRRLLNELYKPHR